MNDLKAFGKWVPVRKVTPEQIDQQKIDDWMRLPPSPTLSLNEACNLGHICKVCHRIC
jgi:hypothetical protein